MLPPGTACRAAAAAGTATNTHPQFGRAAGGWRGMKSRTVYARRADSCEQWDRQSEGTAAAGCRLRFEFERRPMSGGPGWAGRGFERGRSCAAADVAAARPTAAT
eukprot:1415831-Prymnesium_polylepis.1